MLALPVGIVFDKAHVRRTSHASIVPTVKSTADLWTVQRLATRYASLYSVTRTDKGIKCGLSEFDKLGFCPHGIQFLARGFAVFGVGLGGFFVCDLLTQRDRACCGADLLQRASLGECAGAYFALRHLCFLLFFGFSHGMAFPMAAAARTIARRVAA